MGNEEFVKCDAVNQNKASLEKERTGKKKGPKLPIPPAWILARENMMKAKAVILWTKNLLLLPPLLLPPFASGVTTAAGRAVVKASWAAGPGHWMPMILRIGKKRKTIASGKNGQDILTKVPDCFFLPRMSFSWPLCLA